MVSQTRTILDLPASPELRATFRGLNLFLRSLLCYLLGEAQLTFRAIVAHGDLVVSNKRIVLIPGHSLTRINDDHLLERQANIAGIYTTRVGNLGRRLWWAMDCRWGTHLVIYFYERQRVCGLDSEDFAAHCG
jgi:hypothetical protein